MNKQPIILVTGATGAQGGSVARALLQQNKFAVRILTRNRHSDNAISLQDEGAEVMEGDFNDAAGLQAALEGVYGVFGVTNFWEHSDKEYEQGKNLLDAIHRAGTVKHLVFSSLRHYYELSNNALPVRHHDQKAKLREYAKSLQLPASFVQPGFYYENFFELFRPQKAADGNFYFGFPQGETPLAALSIEDLGGVVAKIFDHPVQYIGRTVGVAGDDKPCAVYADILSEVTGLPVKYQYIPRDEYAALDVPFAGDLANMFEVQRLYIPGHQMELIESYGLNPAMQPFKTWARKNRKQLLQVLRAQLQEAAA